MFRALAVLALAAALGALAPTVASAQTTGTDAMAEVLRLRDARDFAAAIALLRRHLAEHPDDSIAARLLAEILYWIGDVSAARRTYEEAQRRHPDAAGLRLQHARMLLELDDRAAARALLIPLTKLDETAAEAETLLGTLAHWRGDLSAARKHFETALRLRPGQADAERGLAQIREMTAPWVRTGVRSFKDDQPLSRAAVIGSAGAHLTPRHLILLDAEAQRFTADGEEAGAAAGAALRSRWAGARLHSEVAGAIRWGAMLEEPEWTGRTGFGFRVLRNLGASLEAGRELYFHTRASLHDPVLIDSVRARIEWETPTGWLGQGSWSRLSYPDANVGESAYWWILAPLARRTEVQIHGGYAFAWEDTRQSRFTPASAATASGPGAGSAPPAGRGGAPGEPVPASQASAAPGTLPGFYAPYYTPNAVRAHSATASLALQPGRRITVRLNGSYGVHARENAPFFYYAPGAGADVLVVQGGFYERRYTPLNARGALEAVLARGVHLEIGIEHTRTAYWRGTQLTAGLKYRLLPVPSR